MAETLKAGDRVRWNTSQGPTTGTASEDNPEYIVKSAQSGAKAAHKPGSLWTL